MFFLNRHQTNCLRPNALVIVKVHKSNINGEVNNMVLHFLKYFHLLYLSIVFLHKKKAQYLQCKYITSNCFTLLTKYKNRFTLYSTIYKQKTVQIRYEFDSIYTKKNN